MTESEYLMQMRFLGEELERAQKADPYDQDAYNKVVDKLNSVNHQWFVTLGARRRIRAILCVSVTLFVLYLIYCLLCEAFEWGPR